MKEVKCFSFNGKSCPAPLIDGKVKLRVLADRASLELFANEGAFVASGYEFDIPKDYTLSISANKEIPVDSLVVNELVSIWDSLRKGAELSFHALRFLGRDNYSPSRQITVPLFIGR
jgi:hypothetical protein